jgi:hypothetical protein
MAATGRRADIVSFIGDDAFAPEADLRNSAVSFHIRPQAKVEAILEARPVDPRAVAQEPLA